MRLRVVSRVKVFYIRLYASLVYKLDTFLMRDDFNAILTIQYYFDKYFEDHARLLWCMVTIVMRNYKSKIMAKIAHCEMYTLESS